MENKEHVCSVIYGMSLWADVSVYRKALKVQRRRQLSEKQEGGIKAVGGTWEVLTLHHDCLPLRGTFNPQRLPYLYF